MTFIGDAKYFKKIEIELEISQYILTIKGGSKCCVSVLVDSIVVFI